jgi:hypothetical protein
MKNISATATTMTAGKRNAAVSVYPKENTDAAWNFFPKTENFFSDSSVLIPPSPCLRRSLFNSIFCTTRFRGAGRSSCPKCYNTTFIHSKNKMAFYAEKTTARAVPKKNFTLTPGIRELRCHNNDYQKYNISIHLVFTGGRLWK